MRNASARKHLQEVLLYGVIVNKFGHPLSVEIAPSGLLCQNIRNISNQVCLELTKESVSANLYPVYRSVLHMDIKAPKCILYHTPCLKLNHFIPTCHLQFKLWFLLSLICNTTEGGRVTTSKCDDAYAHGMQVLENIAQRSPLQDLYLDPYLEPRILRVARSWFGEWTVYLISFCYISCYIS